MPYTGAPAPEVRSEWAPFFEAWSQGLPGPPKPVREALASPREGPPADLQRGLALMGLTRRDAEALGKEVEERRRAGQEEDEDPSFPA